MKENMGDESKEKNSSKHREEQNDLLMKPFNLGWSREVVRRVITKNGTPNCDVYYFTPNGKKIRSLTEIRGNLTDGLSPECFSFKRELLGFGSSYESIRDARIRKKGDEKGMEKGKGSLRNLKRAIKSENPVEENVFNAKEYKRKKTSRYKDLEKAENEIKVEGGKLDSESKSDGKIQEGTDIKSRRSKLVKKEEEEIKSFRNKKKTKTKVEKFVKEKLNVRCQTMRKRKEVLNKIRRGKQAKQAKVVPGKKILSKVRGKGSSKRTAAKTKSVKEAGLNNKRGKKKSTNLKKTRKSLKNQTSKNENAKDEASNSEIDKKSAASDLKSIVKKNIGKYREMREKQKLGIIKSPIHTQNRKIVVGNITRTRSEPISKNKPFYLKPLEKGWRRELVYRMNCAGAGQQADVYYFHPNGKKLRSSREIAENLTHGLSLEYFTFRKEPLGCGEPSEIIRNARTNHKNLSAN